MQQDDPWSLEAANKSLHSKPAQTAIEAEPRVPASLQEALLALDHHAAPVFAVLDGAQFDNLPQELLLGGFVSRPLYLDRGDNNPEQVITAPHMVWLDERPEKITGRAPQETILALLALIASRPAAVFWQCPKGADALYKHLRGINMVLYPKAALPNFVEPEPIGTGEIQQSETPDNHTLTLFRHADANIVAQVVQALNPAQLSRLIGPCHKILCEPGADWANGLLMLGRQDTMPLPHRGLLRLEAENLRLIEEARHRWLTTRTTAYLRCYAKKETAAIPDDMLRTRTRDWLISAASYGVTEEAAFRKWCYLQAVTGGRLEDGPDLARVMAGSPNERVSMLMRETIKLLRAG